MYYYIKYTGIDINKIKEQFNPLWLQKINLEHINTDDIILGNIIDIDMLTKCNLYDLLISLIGYKIEKICNTNNIIIFPDLNFTISNKFNKLLEYNDINITEDNNILFNLSINNSILSYSNIYSYINFNILNKILPSFVNYGKKELPNDDYNIIIYESIMWSINIIDCLYNYINIDKCKISIANLESKISNIYHLSYDNLYNKITKNDMYFNKYKELCNLKLYKQTLDSITNYRIKYDLLDNYNAEISAIISDNEMIINNLYFNEENELFRYYNSVVMNKVFYLIKYNMLNKLYVAIELFTSWSNKKHNSLLLKYNNLQKNHNMCITYLIIYRQIIIYIDKNNNYNLVILYLDKLINKLNENINICM